MYLKLLRGDFVDRFSEVSMISNLMKEMQLDVLAGDAGYTDSAVLSEIHVALFHELVDLLGGQSAVTEHS
jgi:hypothetical protein